MASKLMVRINASKSSKSWNQHRMHGLLLTHDQAMLPVEPPNERIDHLCLMLMPMEPQTYEPALTNKRSFPLTSPRRWPCEGVPTQSRRLAVDDVSLLMGVPDWLAITLSTDELHPLVAMPTTEPIQVRQMRCQDHPSNPPNIIVYKVLFTFYINLKTIFLNFY